MTWYPAAERDPITQWPTGPFPDDGRGDDRKHVWHVTVGSSYPRSTYVAGGGVPHWTIDRDGTVYQHYPTSFYSRALLNLSGGVQTNFDDAYQTELVGFPNEDLTPLQLEAAVDLKAWVEDTLGVARTWPGGRPPNTPGQTAHVTRATWDNVSGNYGHSQVPENDHWDPAFTDRTWAALQAEEPDVETIKTTFGRLFQRTLYVDENWIVNASAISSTQGRNFWRIDRRSGDVAKQRFGRVGDTPFAYVDGDRVWITVRRGTEFFTTEWP